VSRLTPENEAIARQILRRYPVPKSALIPLCHLAQEQDGYLADDAMEHVAELVGVTPAEVIGTASFYEMFKRHECGTYLVNICTSISCHLMGGDELLHHAEEALGVKAGGTTADGTFTLDGYECQAACTEAPALQVNYRYFHKVTPERFGEIVDDLRAGRLADTVPPHGTLARSRQSIPDARSAGAAHPTVGEAPVWLGDQAALHDQAPGDEG